METRASARRPPRREAVVRSVDRVSLLACQSIPNWNQIIAWLKETETLRQTAAGS